MFNLAAVCSVDLYCRVHVHVDFTRWGQVDGSRDVHYKSGVKASLPVFQSFFRLLKLFVRLTLLLAVFLRSTKIWQKFGRCHKLYTAAFSEFLSCAFSKVLRTFNAFCSFDAPFSITLKKYRGFATVHYSLHATSAVFVELKRFKAI